MKVGVFLRIDSHKSLGDSRCEWPGKILGFPKGGFCEGGNLNNWGGARTDCNN